MVSTDPDEPSARTRRKYDSPVRRAQAAETQERILQAACDLVHEFQSWDWRPLTFRAVAERAGVGERTVYRHFSTEQGLHEAVMRRLGEESGISYDDLTLDDVSDIGARVFASMSSFEAAPWVDVVQGVFETVDLERHDALVAAVETAGRDWTEEQRRRAAAALDILWTAPSYQRLVTSWHFDAGEAAEVVDWLIAVVVDAIRAGNRPEVGQRTSNAEDA